MKKYAVIGLGSFGYHVAKTLYEDGHDVIAMDQNRDRVQEIESFCSDAIILDARDIEALKSFGIEEMDGIVVSTGQSISTSILICYRLSEIGVKNITVKAVDDDHAQILKKIGATDTVQPEKDMAFRLARGMSQPNIMEFFPLEAKYDVVQIPPAASFVGKDLRELDLRGKYDVHILAIKETVEEKFHLVPSPDYVIKDTDLLILMGDPKNIKKIKEAE